MPPTLWVRAEIKTGEARVALSPAGTRQLISQGFQVVVERAAGRAIPDADFASAGATLAPPGSWTTAPEQAYILGLKELPEQPQALAHPHIYFAHAYKHQQGWQSLLKRFGAGGGQLLDLEYLLNSGGSRIAAFGYWAGFTGAALAVLTWCGQQLGQHPPLGPLEAWSDREALLQQLRSSLEAAARVTPEQPDILVIGAAGRVGSGACELAQALGLMVTPWDMEETAAGGPFQATLEHAILVNCVLVNRALPPFIDHTLIARADRRLSVIADVSCDPFGAYNPIPVYDQCTDFATPLLRLRPGSPPLDLIAIDNLPALLPAEASEDYAAQLLPALQALAKPDSAPWVEARELFLQYCQLAEEA